MRGAHAALDTAAQQPAAMRHNTPCTAHCISADTGCTVSLMEIAQCTVHAAAGRPVSLGVLRCWRACLPLVESQCLHAVCRVREGTSKPWAHWWMSCSLPRDGTAVGRSETSEVAKVPVKSSLLILELVLLPAPCSCLHMGS
jgi:hypothetical protein